MNAVIPYRHAHNHDGLELRYAIRALEKHFPALEQVVLVGDRPEWCSACRIPFPDLPGKKDLSLIKKIEKYCVTNDEPFLYYSDDYFPLKPFGPDLPAYYSGYCWQMAMKASDIRYKNMFRRCPETWRNFMVHVPMVMIPENFRLAAKSKLLEKGELPIKSLYASYAGLWNAVERPDFQIRSVHKIDNLRAIVDGLDFFATKNNAINHDMLLLLEELYPTPSSFEN